MATCGYPGCLEELPPRVGRGRSAEFCQKHAKERKRDQDKAAYKRRKAARINSDKPETIYEERIPQCCLDWRKAGRSNRRTCPQHKTWNAFIRYSRDFYRTSIRLNGESTGQDLDTIISLFATNRGARVSADPDSWKPITREDKAQDKALADWIDAGSLDAAETQEIYANEAAKRRYPPPASTVPDGTAATAYIATLPYPPPDLTSWRDRCAEGRRWHKTDAFLYPPEMNRGGDWVTGI